MTGSTRISSTSAFSVRGPYSAPQTAASSNDFLPVRNSGSAGLATSRLPAPFVPPEFRALKRSNVTVVPVVDRSLKTNVAGEPESAAMPISTSFNVAEPNRAPTPISTSVGAVEPDNEAMPISMLFSDEAAPPTDCTSFIEAQYLGHGDASNSTELPWIDAFVAEAPNVEETWPLDEAGQRLNELTQSLSSIDASRERLEADRLSAEAAPPPSSEPMLSMWNEEEWIDIMPPSVNDIVSHAELNPAVNDEVTKIQESSVEEADVRVSIESAARALEGLAQRVRAGEIQVPAFPTELGQEAMLAGLLASMLGWRR